MASSAPYLAFKNKLLHFDDDIEFADILYSTIKATSAPENGNTLFEHQLPDKHPNISRYKICQENRLQIMRHLKSSISSSYIKDLYEEVTIYLRSIIKEAYQNASVSPERIIGEHKISMSAVDILSGYKDGTLVREVIENMFQSIENERSTIGLIKKVCKKLGIKVSDKTIDTAVYYLEIRHKLVHTDGYADEDFKKTHTKLKYTGRGYIDLTYTTLREAKKAVCDLIISIDEDAIKKGILHESTYTP